MSRWHPFIIATQFAEDYMCRHTDKVISLLPKAEEYLASRGLAAGKFLYAPNGIVVEEWREIQREPLPAGHAEAFDRERARGNKLAVYAGGHGLSNNLDVLLDAAAAMRAEKVSFLFVGSGAEKSRLEARVRAEALTNVVFLPPVAKAAVPAVLAESDVLILSFASRPLYRFGISPNKLMDYMMAAKPIVAAMRAGNNPVAEHGCGITVAPEDSAEVADAMRQILALADAQRAELGNNGRRAVLENYTYEALARRIAPHFES